MKVDLNVKNAYAEKAFRWKTLTNDPATGKRAQIMQLNNSRGVKTLRQEPFAIKLALVLKLTDQAVQSSKVAQTQLATSISLLNLGLHKIKPNETVDFIATRKLTSDINTTIQS